MAPALFGCSSANDDLQERSVGSWRRIPLRGPGSETYVRVKLANVFEKIRDRELTSTEFVVNNLSEPRQTS